MKQVKNIKIKKAKNKLSIVIPILNEEKNILPLTLSLINKIKNIDFEIIFVDDNSLDQTQKILLNLKKRYKFFKPIIRNKKRDLTQSCFDGIEKAKYNNILIMDGDLQHDPIYINKIFAEYKNNNYDIVIGARNLLSGSNQGLSEFRRIASVILIFSFSIFNIKTSDPMSGFFMFHKNIYFKNKKFLFGKGFKILIDFIINSKKNLIVKDVFIKFKRRHNNKSKMNFRILFFLIQFYFLNIFKKFFTK